MKIGYIYKIKNLINNKHYIGQTKYSDVKIRWNQHIKGLNKGKYKNQYLQNAWNKDGKNNFIFEIIEKIEADSIDDLQDILNDLEEKYISEYKSMYFEHGYNLRYGGNNNILCEDIRNKIRNTLTGKKQSKETIEKRAKGQIGENNPFYNKKHSEKIKQQISEKISEKQKGENNPFYGKKHSEKTKNQISITKKKQYDYKILKQKDLIVNIYIKLKNDQSEKSIMQELNITKTFLFNIKNKVGIYGKIIDNFERENCND